MNIWLSKNRSKYFSLVFTAMTLSLSLLFSLISNFMPFILGAAFLRIDIGMVFIFLTFIISKWKYGLTVLVANFIIHPILPGTNISFIELFYIGKLIYIITSLFYISIFIFCYKIFNKKHILLSLIISIFSTTIIVTLLNGVIFTPIFLYLISNGFYSINFIELMQQYTTSNLNLIFITSNYWGGISLVYGLFNLFLLSINSALFLIIFKNIKLVY